MGTARVYLPFWVNDRLYGHNPEKGEDLSKFPVADNSPEFQPTRQKLGKLYNRDNFMRHTKEHWHRTFSPPRFALMTSIFLSIVSSIPLFLLLVGRPYGPQLASVITYTLVVVFFTFARTGTRAGHDLPAFKFTCPAVEPQIPRLLRRHLGFLVALLSVETVALAVRPTLPDWWNIEGRKGSPFFAALMLLCIGLAGAEVLSSRSLLDRAHREFSAQSTE